MKNQMDHGTETQGLLQIAQKVALLIIVANADSESGNYSRYQEHLNKYNNIIQSLIRWPRYADFMPFQTSPNVLYFLQKKGYSRKSQNLQKFCLRRAYYAMHLTKSVVMHRYV